MSKVALWATARERASGSARAASPPALARSTIATGPSGGRELEQPRLGGQRVEAGRLEVEPDRHAALRQLGHDPTRLFRIGDQPVGHIRRRTHPFDRRRAGLRGLDRLPDVDPARVGFVRLVGPGFPEIGDAGDDLRPPV